MNALYILRHGETEWNVLGRMQGGLDSLLTDRGRSQALQQRKILQASGLEALPVYCSPQGRALETARLAVPVAVPIIDPNLSEVGMGSWQGRTMAEIAAEHPGLFADPHPFLWKFEAPGGESLKEMRDRIRAFLTGAEWPAIVVTHGVTSQLIRAEILRLKPQDAGDLEDRQGVVYRVAVGEHQRMDRSQDSCGP